jgi:hypothetical protein
MAFSQLDGQVLQLLLLWQGAEVGSSLLLVPRRHGAWEAADRWTPEQLPWPLGAKQLPPRADLMSAVSCLRRALIGEVRRTDLAVVPASRSLWGQGRSPVGYLERHTF